ncbi:MAG: hypothetical protein RDU25_04640 [Patescibacteria group bacterium]|nr:hypothetical protein [Patescibacteria group bacterium]
MGKQKKNYGSGLIASSSQVAAAPARAVTSHVRHVFRRRYAGRYRFARLVFAFDAFLLAILGTLLIFNLVLIFRGMQTADPGLEVSFATPELRTADVIPLELKVRVTDGRTHTGVKVGLRLPEEMDLIQAWPAAANDGTWTIGSLSPGEVVTQRLLVHLDATINTRVALGFSLSQYHPILFEQTLIGSDARSVHSSALRLRTLFPVGGVSEDAQIPVVIENRSTATSSPISIVLAGSTGASRASLGEDGVYSLQGLPAKSQKIVFLDVGDSLEKDRLNFMLHLQSGGRKVDQLELDLVRDVTVPVVIDGIRQTASAEGKTVQYSEARSGARLVVVEKETSAFRQIFFDAIDLQEGQGEVPLKEPEDPASGRLIFAARFDGTDYFLSGRAVEAEPARLPFDVQARYYTQSGDQLGLGPLPPVVGEKTRYWILWTLGPFDRSLRDLVYKAKLAKNVSATGQFASTIPLDFSFSGTNVEMSADEIGLAGSGKITFGFEVELRPDETQEGLYADLLSDSSVEATDEFGEVVQVTAKNVDTNLTADEKAQDKGVVER